MRGRKTKRQEYIWDVWVKKFGLELGAGLYIVQVILSGAQMSEMFSLATLAGLLLSALGAGMLAYVFAHLMLWFGWARVEELDE